MALTLQLKVNVTSVDFAFLQSLKCLCRNPKATEYGVASETLGTSTKMDTAASDVPLSGS